MVLTSTTSAAVMASDATAVASKTAVAAFFTARSSFKVPLIVAMDAPAAVRFNASSVA